MSNALVVARVAVLVLILGFQVSAAPAANASTGRTAPALAGSRAVTRQLALGVAMQPDSVANLDDFTASVGHVPALWTIWNDWGGASPEFPTELAAGVAERGSVPFIWWEPVTTGNLNDDTFTNERIIAGDFDEYIRQWSEDAKAFGQLVIVRFAHEMDGNWFPWGVGRNGNTASNFVAAWRHVVSIFRSTGASNVRFLWSPFNPDPSVYPGAAYVDYVGFTALNWGRQLGQRWLSMTEILGPLVRAASRFGKPIIVAELGTAVDQPGHTKAGWIRTGYLAAFRRYPQIAALVYFNVDTSPGQPDWRLNNPDSALQAYTAIVGRSEFQGSLIAQPQTPTVSLSLPARTQREAAVDIAASDPSRTGITGYFLSENPTLPIAPSWQSSPPSTFSLSGSDGPKTIYAWVENGAGQISAPASATTVLDTTPPTLIVSEVTPVMPTGDRQLTLEISAGEVLDCSSVDVNDFVLSNATFTDVSVGTDGGCVVELLSTVPQAEAGSTSIAAAASFSVSDLAGNDSAMITGLPVTWTIEPGSQDSTPPVAAAPEVTLADLQPMTGKRAWAHVTWPPASDDTGIASYEVQWRQGRKDWSSVSLNPDSSQSVDLLLTTRTRVAFRVRAADIAGNWSDWAETSVLPLNRYEENSPYLKYSGDFRRHRVQVSPGAFVRESSHAGDSVRVVFSGVSIAWVSTIDTDMGIAEVWLDGSRVAAVDLFGQPQYASVVWSTATTPGVLHTLEIRVSGDRDSGSSGQRVDIDSILILG